MNKPMKKTAALLLGTAIALSASGAAAYAEEAPGLNLPAKLWLQIDNHNLGVDDAVEHMEAAPFIRNGVTYVPFALLAEKSGARINYNGKQTVYMKTKNNIDTYVFTIGKDTYTFNSKETKLAGKLMIKNGRIVVPLRDVGKILGWKVASYDNEKKIIQLTQ